MQLLKKSINNYDDDDDDRLWSISRIDFVSIVFGLCFATARIDFNIYQFGNFFLFILCGINLIFASCLEGQRSPGKFRAFTDLWQPAEGNERAEPGDAGRWFAEKCFSPLSFCPSSGWIMKSLGFYISHHFGGQNIKVEMDYYSASSCFCLQRIYWEITDSSSSECPDLR